MDYKMRFAQAAITRGLEQASNEQALKQLYERFCVTGDENYLSDLVLYAERLCWKNVRFHLSNNPYYRPDDFEDYIQELSMMLSQQLRQDFQDCLKRENIVYLIRSLYRNRSIDISRALSKNGTKYAASSLEAMGENEDGSIRDVIGTDDLPSSVDPDDFLIRTELFQKLYRIYIDNMLNYDGEPQKALSLCYARILYRLQLLLDPEEIERAAEKKYLQDARTQTSDDVKRIDAIQKVQGETKATSVKWAREKMSNKTIAVLTDESETILRKNYNEALRWGNNVRTKLDEASPYHGGVNWGNLIYTETFTEDDTTDWAQSIHNSITNTVCRQIKENPSLRELVAQYDSPIMDRIMKAKKGREKECI